MKNALFEQKKIKLSN